MGTQSASLGQTISAVDTDIDEQVRQMRLRNMAEQDIAFFDRVVRPFLRELERARSGNADPEEFVQSTVWMTQLILSETILNVVPKSEPDMVIAKANEAVRLLTMTLSETINASLNVKPQQVSHA